MSVILVDYRISFSYLLRSSLGLTTKEISVISYIIIRHPFFLFIYCHVVITSVSLKIYTIENLVYNLHNYNPQLCNFSDVNSEFCS